MPWPAKRQPPDDADATAGEPRSGRITAIRPQVRDPERVSIALDGAFAFGLPADLAAREGLVTGDELSAERVAALLALDESARATTAALAFLSYRPRSEREVRDRLRQKGYAPAAVDAAIARLEGWRYLDDADFARRWVENRASHQPRGRRLLEQELRHKGVDRETAREVLDDTPLDEEVAALELARTKLRAYAKDDPAAARRKLGAFLARRGYGYDTIRPTLERLFGELEEEDVEPPPD
jgi:regulatory protein